MKVAVFMKYISGIKDYVYRGNIIDAMRVQADLVKKCKNDKNVVEIGYENVNF